MPAWLLAFASSRLLEYAPFASLWFPPTAVTFAALVLFGLRGFAPVAIAAMIGHLWTLQRLDLEGTVQSVLVGGVGFALAHTLPMALLANAMQRTARRDPLGRFGPATLTLLIGGGALACAFSALAGSAALVAGGLADAIDLRWSVVPWLIGDYTGLLALGPLLVESVRHRVAPEPGHGMPGRLALQIALLLGLITLVLLAASRWPDHDPIVFTVLFALVVQQWISHAHAPRYALLALALAAVTIAVLTAALTLGQHALKLQFALIALSLSCYSALSFLTLRDDHRRLTLLLSTDPLTAAASRAHFAASTEAAMADAMRRGIPLCLVMLDLDHLKRINDSLGHGAGDEALRRFAQLCRQQLRGSDLLGRLGGDEFALCFAGLGLDATQSRVAALLASLSGASTADLPLAASAGVAQMAEGESYANLLHRADHALMQAKREGRGRVVVA